MEERFFQNINYHFTIKQKLILLSDNHIWHSGRVTDSTFLFCCHCCHEKPLQIMKGISALTVRTILWLTLKSWYTYLQQTSTTNHFKWTRLVTPLTDKHYLLPRGTCYSQKNSCTHCVPMCGFKTRRKNTASYLERYKSVRHVCTISLNLHSA